MRQNITTALLGSREGREQEENTKAVIGEKDDKKRAAPGEKS